MRDMTREELAMVTGGDIGLTVPPSNPLADYLEGEKERLLEWLRRQSQEVPLVQ